LIEEIERTAHCSIEPMRAAGVIDGEFAGRSTITADEMRSLLFQLAEPPHAPWDALPRARKEKAR